MIRRVLIGLVVLALAIGGYLFFTHEEPATLSISVSGLPKEAEAKVHVSGPDEYTVTGSDTREVKPGEYTVAVSGVRTRRATHYAAEEVRTVTVGKGGFTRVGASYAVSIPHTTKILDARNPGIAAIDGTKITFDSDAAKVKELKPGYVFAVGEGPQTPNLLIRRVKDIRRTPDGRTVVSTKPARFNEALDSGVVQFEWADSPPEDEQSGLSTQTGATGSTVEDMEEGSEPIFSAETGATEVKLTDKHKRTCSAGSGALRWHLMDIEAKFFAEGFRWHNPNSLPEWPTVGMDATISDRLEGELQGEAKCGWEWEGKKLGKSAFSKVCTKVVAKLVKIGRFQLDCYVQGGGEANLEASATTYGLRFREEQTVHYCTTGWGSGCRQEQLTTEPRFTIPEIPKEKGKLKGKYKLGAKAGVKVVFEGGDPTGTAWTGMNFNIQIGSEMGYENSEFKAEAGKVEFSAKAHVRTDLRVTEKTFEQTLFKKQVAKIWEWQEGKKTGSDRVEREPAADFELIEYNGPRHLPADVWLPLETQGLSGRAAKRLSYAPDAASAMSRTGHVETPGPPPKFDPCGNSSGSIGDAPRDTRITDQRYAIRRNDEVPDSVPLAERPYVEQQLFVFRHTGDAAEFLDEMRTGARECAEADKNMGKVKESFRTPYAGTSAAGFGARVERDLGEFGISHGYYQAARIANTVILTFMWEDGPITDSGGAPRQDVLEMHRKFSKSLCARKEWTC